MQVQFISKSESAAYFHRLGIETDGLFPGSRAAARLKSYELFYKSRLATAREVSLALADAQGDFSECVVWPFDLVWGDQSADEDASADWAAYARWREGHGEPRRLYEAPDHVAEAKEHLELARLLEMAIYLGWDTLVAARPGSSQKFVFWN
ncbi:MAG: hypothetical protein AB7L65_08320 [Hyphomonadaceae bacterium]